MSIWSKLKSGIGLAAPVPAGKPGARAYAIGDVHGCLDQLDRMLAVIGEDMVARPIEKKFVVLLGDLIDRGPDSRGVVERLATYSTAGAQLICLMGNHEEFLLRALKGEPGVLHSWLDYGGTECVKSYGGDPDQLAALEEANAVRLLRDIVPPHHQTFIAGFADTFRFGDYLLTHAGIRPGVPLYEQTAADLRWIREPFLSDTHHHGVVVVHGHTIVDAVVERPNRIGIDTGAYRTGVLTGLTIEGESRRFLQVDAGRLLPSPA